MKNKFKNRIISLILAILMIVTSTNLTNLFETNLHSSESYEQSFNYTGNIQTFTAPYTGRYYIELYGAQGGGASSSLGGLGGKLTGYYNLYAGQTIYVAVGGAGSVNGAATYNGGGAGGNGTGSGGGATSVLLEQISNGELVNYKDNTAKVIAVAAGGGGKGSNQISGAGTIGGGCNSVIISHERGVELGLPSSYYRWSDDTQSYHSIHVAETGAGYFGKGQDFNPTNRQGYGGAGGGGWYGGAFSGSGYYGGGGGSQYNCTNFYDTDALSNTNSGNGRAYIKYAGKVETIVSFLTKNVCSVEGIEGNYQITGNAGDTITLPTPDMFDGAMFNKYDITSGDGKLNGMQFTFGLENTILNIDYNSRLMIHTNGYNGENQTINLVYKQLDEYEKEYKVYQSTDGKNWYYAAFANDALNNANPTYSYGYTGTVVPFTSKTNAIYNVVLLGAVGGGDQNGAGGKGGKTTGQIELKAGETIYIVVGQAGGASDYAAYNGGGLGRGSSAGYAAGGGGATHIATASGVLSSFSNASNASKYVIAVAGGGGGCSDNCAAGGGAGGGKNGSKGGGSYGGAGGTQTSGYAFGQGQPARPSQGAGGGGGWYGGYSVTANTTGAGGGGGSGYIGSRLYNGATSNGVNSGHGSVTLEVYDAFTSDEYMEGVIVKDKNAPNAATNIAITDTNASLLTITWTKPSDNGTTYYHKVESYDTTNNTLLQTSDIVSDTVTSGIKGYYYYVDNNATGTATASHTFTGSEMAQITRGTGKYIHVAAVDYAGNISTTSSYQLPYAAKYTVNHRLMNTDGTTYKKHESQIIIADIGTSVTPAVKTYEGFTSPSTLKTITVLEDGSAIVDYYYTRNKYDVTYIDVIDSITGTKLNTKVSSKYFGETVSGGESGTDNSDNKYYKGYYYDSHTESTVTTNGATVYRIFKLRTINVTGSIYWDDKSNEHKSRPDDIVVTLYQNGTKIDSTKGYTKQNTNAYSFNNLPKYDTSTGKEYIYTVSQGNVVSQNNPEDRYDTTIGNNGFDFTNTLKNSLMGSAPPSGPINPPAIPESYQITGTITWVDNNDVLGYRPYKLMLTLYRNGIEYSSGIYEVDSSVNSFDYAFTNLPKYDENMNLYKYTVKQEFTAKALTWDPVSKEMITIDAYSTEQSEFDFINTLVDIEDKPIIPVKPDHINTLTIKLDFNKNIDWEEIRQKKENTLISVNLKQLETIIKDGEVTYSTNYSGMNYNSLVTPNGITINNIPSGKYEINVSKNIFITEDIISTSYSIITENGKTYLIIPETNVNQTGVITIKLNNKPFYGYEKQSMFKNLFRI